MKYEYFAKIIISAGMYGLYAALFCVKQRIRVAVLEYNSAPFMRVPFCNQAQVHSGYHCPRSYSTSIKLLAYFNFSTNDSWTNPYYVRDVSYFCGGNNL
jgi:monoamine oxidase